MKKIMKWTGIVLGGLIDLIVLTGSDLAGKLEQWKQDNFIRTGLTCFG